MGIAAPGGFSESSETQKTALAVTFGAVYDSMLVSGFCGALEGQILHSHFQPHDVWISW
jgi:hypothetical protein